MGAFFLGRSRLAHWVAALFLITLVGCGGSTVPEGPIQEAAAQPAALAAPDLPGSAALEVKPFEGFLAPEIEAQDVRSGERIRLSDFRGRVVMVNFWATWCQYCREEMLALERFSRENQGRVQVLAVAADGREPPEVLAAFAEELGLSFPVVFDGGGASAQYRAYGLPITLFLDGNGVVRVRVGGPMTPKQMAELAQAAAAAAQQGETTEGTEG